MCGIESVGSKQCLRVHSFNMKDSYQFQKNRTHLHGAVVEDNHSERSKSKKGANRCNKGDSSACEGVLFNLYLHIIIGSSLIRLESVQSLLARLCKSRRIVLIHEDVRVAIGNGHFQFSVRS